MSLKLCFRFERFGVNYSIEYLETGDLQIGDRIIIERKTIRDLIDSIIDGRFIQQANRLVYACMHPIMIIEGNDFRTQRTIHPNAIQGALAYLAIQTNISVIMLPNYWHVARFITRIISKEGEYGGTNNKIPDFDVLNTKSNKYRNQMHAQDKKTFQFAMKTLQAIQSVGYKTAKLLLQNYSIGQLANMNLNQLKNIQGLNVLQARQIHKTMGFVIHR